MEATHRLDETKLAQAMTLLTAEHDTNTPSRARKILLGLFIVAVPAFVVLVVSVFLSMLTSASTEQSNVSWVTMALFGMAYLLALAIPVLALLNLSFAWKLLREWRMAKKLGLRGMIQAQWGTLNPWKRFASILQLVPTVAIAFFAMVMCGGGRVVGLFLDPPDNSPSTRWALGAMTIVSLGVLLLLPAIVYIVTRLRQKLQLIDGLRESIASYRDTAAKSGAHFVEIPSQEYEMISKVFERAQIERSRAKYIREDDKAEDSHGFGLRKTKPVRQWLEAMDAQLNLRVQEQIEALTMDPKPKKASWDEKSGHYLLRLDDASAAIEYSVDDAHRIIDVLDVQNPSGAEAVHTDTKE